MTKSDPETRRRGSFLVPGLLAFVVVAGGFYGWQRYRTPDQTVQKSGQAAAAAAPVPVSLATASRTSFAVTLDGLGTVQAYNTVVVRTRVDGQIDSVAFQEGKMVNQGDLLVQIDPRPYKAALDQAKAKKDQDEASLSNAKADLERYTKLGSYGTRQQLDTQAATVSQQTAQVAADQAVLDNARTQLGYATVTAPITGLAGFRQVDTGNIVNAATQTGIVTITQLEPISVVFTAPEEQLPEISRALVAGTVPVAAYAGDGVRKLADGKLEIVNNQVDTASGTIRLKATFDNKDHALWPGLSITTRTLASTMQDVLTIPDDAVQHGPDGLYTYVVDGTGVAHVKAITIGRSGGDQAVVTSGLDAGQKVIVAGQYRVQEGTRVIDRRTPVQQANAEVR